MRYAEADGTRLSLLTFPGPEWLTLTQAWYTPGGDIAVFGEANGPNSIDIPGGELDFDADDALFALTIR